MYNRRVNAVSLSRQMLDFCDLDKQYAFFLSIFRGTSQLAVALSRGGSSPEAPT